MDDAESAVTVRFVLPKGKTEATCSDELSEAFEKSEENTLKPSWIGHDDVLQLNPGKTDVFVMDPFDGAAYDFVCRFKCTVVGPRCLLTCLLKGVQVPALPYPMFTAAMRDLVITSTGFEKDKKSRLQNLIERMGGIYSNAFHDGVTHLVADVVRSKKYEVAIQKDIPVMTEEWVDLVWERGKREVIHATEAQFSKYACPALKGLNITVSQMAKKDKDLMKKMIENHGGIYSGILDMDKTTILIIPAPEGDKYNHARKWKIPCLSPDWIYDSIEKGFCLSTGSYRVDQAKASTPTKNDETMARLQEVSMCSTILMPPGNETAPVNRVDDTVASNSTVLSSESNQSKSTDKLLSALDIARVRKAGAFLQGCSLFLSGFSEKQQEQLRRVIQQAGGTRMNQLTASVTHVVAAARVPEHAQILAELRLSPHQVSLQWLVESMQMGGVVPEADFAFQTSRRESAAAQQEDDQDTVEQIEHDILAQYKKPSVQAEQDADDTIQFKKPDVGDDGRDEDVTFKTTTSQSVSQVSRFLIGKRVALLGIGSEEETEMSGWICEAGGELVSTFELEGTLDYLFVPEFGYKGERSDVAAKEVVTLSWLEDCLDEGRLVPVSYFHRAISIDDTVRPCEGVVIGITNFAGRERQYIANVASALGMLAQEIFAKRDKNGAKASTHLVCANPEGAKYDAALKWNLPVVSRDWVLACLKHMTWISEKPYLLGNATAFTSGKPLPFEMTEEEVEDMTLGTPAKASEAMDVDRTPAAAATASKHDLSLKTPSQALHTLTLETPGDALDLEKLRPKPINLDLSESSPGKWAGDSQPSPGVLTQQQHNAQLDKQASKKSLPFYLENVKTPETPYGAFLGRNPSPTTKKFYKRQCTDFERFEMSRYKRSELARTSEAERERVRNRQQKEKLELEAMAEQERRALDPEKLQRGHELAMDALQRRGVPVLGREDKSFDQLMEEKWKRQGKSWADPRAHASRGSRGEGAKAEAPILDGVVVYVAKKLQEVQNELHRAVEALGGECRAQYSRDVTHVVFTGKPNDLAKEFRTAKSEGKIIVAPDWIHMCRDEQRFVEEEAFPHTFNPRMSLNISVTSPSKRGMRRKNSTQAALGDGASKSKKIRKKPDMNMEGTLQEQDECEDENEGEAIDVGVKANAEAAEKEDDLSVHLAKFDELVDTSKDSSKDSGRRSMRIMLTSTGGEDRNATLGTNAQHCDNPTTQFPEAIDSQGILWRDPKEEQERQLLKAKLATETQALQSNDREDEDDTHMPTFSSMELPDNLTDIMAAAENKENRQSQSEPTKSCRFMMSSVADEDRARFMSFLDGVGVEHSDGSNCDADATHIVAQKLSRSEKMLGSIASGKWVLHPSYMDACIAAGKLLAEDKFEWGNPKNGFGKNLPPLEANLARAGFKWRQLVQSGAREGAFGGIRAIVHTSNARAESFKRLIELGKGVVLAEARPPYSDPHGATHCFSEANKMPNVTVDYARLAEHGVAVVGPVYLNEFLVTDPAPKVDNFLVDEIKPFWRKR